MQSSIYTLTASEAEKLRPDAEFHIIATGPWARGPMSIPHRLVIRDQPGQYVVHVQIIGNGIHFEYGDYCLKAHPNAFMNAWEHFNRRVRLYHNLNPPESA